MVKSLNFVGLFSDPPKIRRSHDWETTKLQEKMFSYHTVTRIIIGKICTLDTGIVTHLLISCLSFEIMNDLGSDLLQLPIHCSSY